MPNEDVRGYVDQYCKLRDVQFAAYELYARKHDLTAKELFVLDLIWFAPDGCLQSEICERLSATRQTISAIIKKFLKKDMWNYPSQQRIAEIRSFDSQAPVKPMPKRSYHQQRMPR